MRIGIDISQVAYPGTGVAVYTEQLVRHLLRIDQKNSYILFGSSLRRRNFLKEVYFNNLNYQSKMQKRIYPLPQTLLSFLWNQLHILDVENFIGRVDVFHTSDWLEPPARVKKVTTIHDLLIYKFPHFIHPTIVANQRRKLAWMKKESSMVIVDSQSTKQDVMEILGVKKDRLRVVYLGIDDRFSPQPKEVRERIAKKYGIGEDYILTFGGIEPRKNVKRVIAAYKILSQRKDFQLVVIGCLPENAKPSSDEGIVFIDSVDYSDLPAIYSGVACFVYPSLYEGFGLPVLEAMSCGCPVVTSNRGSLKEVAGEAAIIVDPEDVEAIVGGIRTILESSDSSYREIVQRGLAWAKQFSWDKTAKETLGVYEEVDIV